MNTSLRMPGRLGFALSALLLPLSLACERRPSPGDDGVPGIEDPVDKEPMTDAAPAPSAQGGGPLPTKGDPKGDQMPAPSTAPSPFGGHGIKPDLQRPGMDQNADDPQKPGG